MPIVFENGLPNEAFFVDLLVKTEGAGGYKLTVPWEWRSGAAREVHEVFVIVPDNIVTTWKQALESVIAFIVADPHAADGEVLYGYWAPPEGP